MPERERDGGYPSVDGTVMESEGGTGAHGAWTSSAADPALALAFAAHGRPTAVPDLGSRRRPSRPRSSVSTETANGRRRVMSISTRFRLWDRLADHWVMRSLAAA